MYHPPSKRTRVVRKISVLFAMWAAVILGVSVLTALTLGYGFNKQDGKIEQGGILQMSSTPTGAAITINNMPFSSQTPTKLVSQPGEYAVKIEKEGYQTWQKTLPIQAGNITWAAYPRLIPKKIVPVSSLELPATLASGLASGSSKKYAFIDKADTPLLTVASLEEEVKTEKITVPTATYTAATPASPQSAFAIELWTGDEKHVLLKHTYGPNNMIEWLLVDLEDATKTVNLTKDFAANLSSPVFATTDGSQIYALVDGSVRLLDLDDQTTSRPLVQSVASFRLYGKYVLYTSQPSPANTQQVGYVSKDFKQPRVIDTVPYDGKSSALIDIGKYYDKYFFLITHGSRTVLSSSATLPDDSTTNFTRNTVKDFSLAGGIVSNNITDNGQFATVQDGLSFATYNLEINQLSTSSIAQDGVPVSQKLQYLDTYMLWGMRGNTLRTYEFDGANQHDIMTVDARFGAAIGPGAKYMYAVAKQPDARFALMRVQLLDIDN